VKNDIFHERKYVIQTAFMVCAAILMLRSCHLQLIDTEFRDIARGMGKQATTFYPSRGLIYDRNGKLLVHNDAMYDIRVIYNQIRNLDTTKLCQLLDIDLATFHNNLNKNFNSNRYSKRLPFIFLSKVSAATYTRFQENQYQFPGFYAELRNVRSYHYRSGAHVLGYISEVNPNQLAADEYYKEGDYIGVSGLEKEYEKELRGKRGKKYLTRDNEGNVVGSYKGGRLDEPAVSGKDLISSIDIELQQYGEKLMQNKRGSIVAIEPSTGEILAFISSPGYDPNLLSINRDRGEAFKILRGDSIRKPLFNRALNAQYPPGSTFKPVMSLIGMQEKATWSGKGKACPGYYIIKNKRYGCRPHAEPISNMAKALRYSCNTYYWQMFRDVVDRKSSSAEGVDVWANYVKSFGLGNKLGIDLPGEKKGNVPTSATYNRMYKYTWRAPTVMSLGIGQGELLVTPIQLANIAAVVANRGYYYKPHLAKQFVGDTTGVLAKYLVRQNPLIENPRHFESVVRGMEESVKFTNSAVPGVRFCGKTGTVQNPHGDDHSTFIGFAPKENPKIAIAVYVENSGYGSKFARPIASFMVEKYMNDTINTDPMRAFLEQQMIKADLLE